MNYGHIIMGIVFIVGVFAIMNVFEIINPTGEYTYGNAGMGRYYAAGGWVQYEPKEACEVMGAKSFDPPRLYNSKDGHMNVACFYFSPSNKNDLFGVPLVQWVVNQPRPNQFNPIG